MIIEVGSVKFIDGKAAGSYGSIVNEGQPVPDAAYRVNHISTAMVRSQGKAPEVAYKELIDFWGEVLDGHICICAHNASFDMAFLKSALERHGYSGNLSWRTISEVEVPYFRHFSFKLLFTCCVR